MITSKAEFVPNSEETLLLALALAKRMAESLKFSDIVCINNKIFSRVIK